MTVAELRPSLWTALADAGVKVDRAADALGLARAGHDARGPCPCCSADRRGSSDARGPIGVRRDGRGWTCHRCDARGDAAALVLAVATGSTASSPAGWARARELAEQVGLVARGEAGPHERSGGHQGRPTSPPGLGPVPSSPAAPATATEERRGIPLDELAAWWSGLPRLGEPTAEPAAAWLRERGIDPAAVALLDLARGWPVGCDWAPEWAALGRRTWTEAGVVAVLPAFDARGELAGLRARRPAKEQPKELAPRGAVVGGTVLADPVGRWLLRRGPVAKAGELVADCPAGLAWRWSGAVVVTEGVPDFLTMAAAPTRAEAGKQTAAVFGLWSGAWTAELGARLPPGVKVAIAVHDDADGERYAEAVRRTLPAGCRVGRV